MRMIFLDVDADGVITEVFVDREGVDSLFDVDLLSEVGAKAVASDVAFGDGFGGWLLGILFVVELELVALGAVFGSGFDE